MIELKISTIRGQMFMKYVAICIFLSTTLAILTQRTKLQIMVEIAIFISKLF